MKLSDPHPLFVGFKLDGGLRRQLDSLEGPERRYVSREESTFLSICELGGDQYVGKIVGDRMTTDRVEDVRRNVLSILQRLCPDARLPTKLDILPCALDEPEKHEASTETPPADPYRSAY